MSEPKRLEIVFVDDDARVLDGLRRQFCRQRKAWNMRFAKSCADALRLLEERRADVVVSDMRMPVMNGAALLSEVQRQWPDTVRLILSGQTERMCPKDIGVVHQFLQKPCSPEQILRAVTQTTERAALIESEELRGIASGLRSLPVLSDVHRRLLGRLNDPDSGMREICEIVEGDIGLSTKLLQMVNSAFFGLHTQVRSVSKAVTLLGLRNLKDLVVAGRVFDALGTDPRSADRIRTLWNASADIGALAGRLARSVGQPADVCDTARLAGTLSLSGRAILLSMMPERFDEGLARCAGGMHLVDAEYLVFGVPHPAMAAYALGLWAFEGQVVESVALQATPTCLSDWADPAHPLTYVHAARSRIAAEGLVEPLPLARDLLRNIDTGPTFAALDLDASVHSDAEPDRSSAVESDSSTKRAA